MLPQAKGCLGPLEAERGKKRSFPTASEEVWPC